MTLRPIGPQAMQAKLDDFRSRMGLEPTSSSAVFQMPANQPSDGLSGQITPGGTSGFAPFNPMGGGAQISSSAPANLKALIEKAANDHHLDPALFDALVATESNYDPSAVSRKRAVGLTQLMPDTARSLGVTDPFDPAQNLRGGAKYLSQMIDRFDGNLEHAVAAYNAGPGAVARYGGVPPYKETQNYVQRVLSLYRSKKP